MYNHTLTAYGEELAKAQALPQNASVDGNGGTANFGGTMGGLQAVAKVNEDITLAPTKTLTVKLQHRDGDDAFVDLGNICSITAPATTYTAVAGTVLGRMVIPTDCKEEGKSVQTTDDAAATGKLDVEMELLLG